MNFKHRAVRLAAALSIAGIISAQVPLRGGTAMAQDGYNNNNSGKFLGTSLTNEQVFTGVTLALLGYALKRTIDDARRAGGTVVTTPGTVTPPTMPRVNVPLLGDSNKPIYDVVAGMPNSHSAIKGLIDDCGDMVGTLRNDGPFTFVAPNNGVLSNVPSSTVSALRADKAKLCELIQNHTIIGRYKYEDLLGMSDKNLLTLSGKTLALTHKDNKVFLDGIEVTASDIAASNGWIHDLKGVIMKK